MTPHKFFFTLLLVVLSQAAQAQATFKAGWTTCNTGSITHEYTYTYNPADSVKLYLADSMLVFASADSLITMTLDYPLHEKTILKVINYMNARRHVVKTEEFKDDNLQVMNEWKYDDKNRKIYHFEDNKLTGNSFKKTYEYTVDKKTGETVATESSYFNGRIEFYTKVYYDRKGVKLKEVRLNDNNKDVVHIESYTYGENGKVKERSVFFPEWKVTKKFEEKEGNEIPKCYRSLPIGTYEKPALGTRISFIKKLLLRNKALLADAECHSFEFCFTNFTNCNIIVATTGVNNSRRVTFRLKEKP